MRLGREIYIALKILLIYAVTTFFFQLSQKLSPLIFAVNKGDGIKNFIEVHLIWFILILLIIIVLFMYIRKSESKFSLSFIHNPLIRLTSGLLIMFDGLFNLLISIPVAFSNLKAIHQFSAGIENAFGSSRATLFTSNVIPSLLNMLQILLGLYLILRKKQTMPEKVD